jgi:HrpA-like RNA helicase
MNNIENNIGIMDPLGIHPNPLNNNPYSDTYKELAKKWSQLPAYKKATEIINNITNNAITLVVSMTGSGKSVLIPKFLLHSFNYNAKIAMTLPKKIITESAALYAAATLDVELGDQIGYKYKGSPKETYSDNTKLLFCTDGTIVSMLLKDPLLKEYDAVIVDEIHERSIQIDFLLYLLKNTIESRPKFKLILMSATINPKVFTDYFENIKVLYLEGVTNFPIKSIYLDRPQTDYVKAGFDMLKDLSNKEGDLIFFVASIAETFKICDKVRDELKGYCIETYSGMNYENQKFLQDKKYFYLTIKDNQKRIIIATNVAESSLTIEGIEEVIDSGQEIFNYYDPITHAKVLEKRFITKSQVKQRMGRTGRTGPGTCYHLYTREDYEKMEDFPLPSIKVSNIAFEILKLLKISKNISEVKETLALFIEPPTKIYIDSGIKDLEKLNLIKSGLINPIGSIVLELKADLMSGLALFAAYQLNCLREVTAIFSMLEATKSSIKSLFYVNTMMQQKKRYANKYGDHLSLLNIFNDYRQNKKTEKYNKSLNNGLLNKAYIFYKKYKQTFKNVMVENKIDIIPNDGDLETKVLAALVYGYKLNIAYNDNRNIYRAYNIKAQIDRDSFLTKFSEAVIYNELVSINKNIKLNIVSSYPKQVDALVMLLTQAASKYNNK